MKPSARVALIVALAATTTPTWASLPFYSPDYTHQGGYQFAYTGGVTPDGGAANTMVHSDGDDNDYLIVSWRGQAVLPSPQQDSNHLNPILRGMNRFGWICGTTERTLLGHTLPALWRPDGSRIDLPPLPGPSGEVNAYAFDVSDAGFAVGDSDNLVDGYYRPAYWTPSSEIVRLENPFVEHNQFWEGSANSISTTDIIAGYVSVGGNKRAMRWDINGSAPILSQTTDSGITYPWTEALKSLDDGTILGYGSNDGGMTTYGILWTTDGEAIGLRALPDSTSQRSYPSAVNIDHYSVGHSHNALGQLVGVRWSPTGEPFALDRLANAPNDARHDALDINDLNFAVGNSSNSDTFRRAVLWTPDGDAVELNSLIQSGSEWDSFSPVTITNTGWIYGRALFDPAGPPESYVRPFTILVPFAGTYGMGDANFDESIDFADLLIVAQNYGNETNGSFDVGDFNLDDSVNFTDLLAIAQNYGDVFTLLPNSPNPTFESDWQAARGMVPEPSVTGLMIGVGMMLRRRVVPAPRLPNAR